MKNNLIELKIPEELKHELLLKGASLKIKVDDDNNFIEGQNDNIFIYEFFYFKGLLKGAEPWLQPKAALESLINNWDGLLSEVYCQLERKELDKTSPDLLQLLSSFYQILFWSNRLPVILNKELFDLKELELKPLNLLERLEFVESRLNSRYGLIQLNEMKKELCKKFYIKFA